MIIGNSINPGLMVNDYSGIANAGALQGQASAQFGKDIGGAISSGVDMYKGIKMQEGQNTAFGKSMDAMAQAFPEQAGMYNEAKMHVMDPNASLIERAMRMNQFKETFNLMNQQKLVNAQIQNYDARTAAAGQAGAAGGGGDNPFSATGK